MTVLAKDPTKSYLLLRLESLEMRFTLLPLRCLPLAFIWLLAANPVLAGVNVTTNVTYGQSGGDTLKLDIAVPDGAGPFPAIVFIHGGRMGCGQSKNL